MSAEELTALYEQLVELLATFRRTVSSPVFSDQLPEHGLRTAIRSSDWWVCGCLLVANDEEKAGEGPKQVSSE